MHTIQPSAARSNEDKRLECRLMSGQSNIWQPHPTAILERGMVLCTLPSPLMPAFLKHRLGTYILAGQGNSACTDVVALHIMAVTARAFSPIS